MELNIQTAELALREAAESNPGAWAEHSRYVAEACKNIASHCKDLSSEQAYIFGLLHDIGRYAGVSSERHLIDGYRYCMERGWGKAAQICISHAFMIQDIATSIGEFDVRYMMIMTVLYSYVTHWLCLRGSVFWKRDL